MTEDNSHAGQGPVLLDIGGEVGALVVTMPTSLLGAEVEIRPRDGARHTAHGHSHGDDPGHHGHDHGHVHDLDHGQLVHVGVVARPSADGPIPTAVFGELQAGDYELYERPSGPVAVVATIRGGQVTEVYWPSAG